ncbi:HTH-type transcriptional regulator CatR [Bordetella hinzii CA90 BAL1384]|uniref:LysR family transcriptional regulator n=1 Tax=Bordetella hinzii TaxID=103855 RepID=UPI00045AA6E4|nr:LysR family transcriptional regulator [Bordetella hinzii]KCB27750.1 HTH-type transcriptional regulator CatR [Bordetella hinzii CA90 BAL1384]QDJ32753.1 LysR family transcriptional regulator [Bordetella hinzii]QWF37291.1 LysR family transcriptional regulator [Bordetella hinzii]QWF41835.1 LysR family transcriptional regulator [Bordetella hinzii]QWF46376.1 LysR family transcriptional regulator [Bordetella hinzii]
MELRHLRYFQTVAREGSFTRAAALLHIAQPPLSRQIRQLEEELGVTLIERGSRGLKLTEAGRFFHEQSLQLTARLDEIVAGTRRLGAQAARWFSIGFVPSTLYGFVPELIRYLRQADAQVEVGLSEMTTLPQIEALKSGRIDLGIGRIPFDDPAIERRVLMEEPLVAALPPSHPLAGRKRLTVAELAAQPFVLYPARPRPNYADHVLGLFRAAGHQPTVIQEANELQTALGLVVAGLGLTLVPASVQRSNRADIVCLPVDAPAFTSPVILSWRRGDSSPFLAQAIAAAERLARQAAAP